MDKQLLPIEIKSAIRVKATALSVNSSMSTLPRLTESHFYLGFELEHLVRQSLVFGRSLQHPALSRCNPASEPLKSRETSLLRLGVARSTG